MNRKLTRLPAEFGPSVRFEVRPEPAAPFRATQETELERLKTRLLANTLADAAPDLNAALRCAANEAAALAWVTFCPLLVFPLLFEEKIEAALHRAKRQAHIYENSRELVAV